LIAAAASSEFKMILQKSYRCFLPAQFRQCQHQTENIFLWNITFVNVAKNTDTEETI